MKQQSLNRTITWVQGTTLTISAVLGCGILVLPSITANSAGPASLLSWIFMSLLSFPIVMTMAQLARLIPSAGGITAYVREAFGSHASSILSWIMLGSVPVGVPTIALTGAYYINYVEPLDTWEVMGIALLMLATSLLLHMKGVEVSSKVSVVAIFMILSLLVTAIIVSIPHVKFSAFYPFAPHGWFSLGSTSVMVFFSFVGWEMITPLSEEFKNPKRDMSVSLLLGAACISVLYISISFVTIGTHSYGGNHIASLNMLVSKSLGASGAFFTTALALFITFSTVHANIAGFSRMVYAQARDGNFPSFFAVLHPKHLTPTRVLAALGTVFFGVLIIFGWLRPSIGTLLKGPGTVFIVSYIFTMLAAIKILKPLTTGWFMALISLIISITMLLFSGWAILYPVVLAMIGELYLHGSHSSNNLKSDE